MTRKEIIKTIVNGLTAQGRPSTRVAASGDLQCLYRGPDTKCAFGFLIPDEDYSPDMEFTYFSDILEKAKAPWAYALMPHRNLIGDFVRAHDEAAIATVNEPERFLEEFNRRRPI